MCNAFYFEDRSVSSALKQNKTISMSISLEIEDFVLDSSLGILHLNEFSIYFNQILYNVTEIPLWQQGTGEHMVIQGVF